MASRKGPKALPWKDLGVDCVIESTGFFVEADKANGHIEAGAKKVMISAPGKGALKTLVWGSTRPSMTLPLWISCQMPLALQIALLLSVM